MPDVREKLVELLCEAHSKATDAEAFADATYAQQLEMEADHLIANGVIIQRWIPVTERLPEDDEQLEFYDDGRLRCITVLAYTEYGRTIPKNRLLVRPSGNKYFDTQVTDGWVWASGTEEVTHWMPLPDAPKGE